MLREEDYREARELLLDNWGKSAQRVIDLCAEVKPFNGDSREFLTHCIACGGNWGGMLLSGIRELYPEVYDAIPDDMGVHAFLCICCVMQLCGVDTSK